MPRRAILLSLLVLTLISLPYLFAWISAGPEHVFGGFLINPQDGYSYQAKMFQGWQGSWRFHLPFAAEPGEGVYLNFLFYLFLGHLARWLGWPILLVFHLARLAGSLALLLSLWRFFKRTGPEGADPTWPFGLAVLGLGLGWLLFPFGWIPSDLWVAETYPLLSMYANPHFPLSLAILLWLIVPGPSTARSVMIALLLSLALSILSPFGVVVCGLALSGWLVWELSDGWRGRPADERRDGVVRWLWRVLSPGGEWPAPLSVRLLTVGVGSLPILLYYQWSVATHPALAVWNAQNQTLTPPAWDVLLALSPALLLAGWAAWGIIRRKSRRGRVLVAWLVMGLIFIYIPVSLQRRFMLGLYVPAAGLAGYALDWLREAQPIRARRLAKLVFGLSLPTLGLMLLVNLFGVTTRAPEYYLYHSEVQALDWIAANTPTDALILAAPQTGLLIPAYTGRRVIYGHPYETPYAEAERAAVEQFFTSGLADGASTGEAGLEFLAGRGVDFIFYGPREQKLGPLPPGLTLQLVFQSSEVSVYTWEAAR